MVHDPTTNASGCHLETAIDVEDLGRIDYASAHARMLALAAGIHERRSGGAILLAEHPAVYTAGRATPAHERPADAVDVERGGRVTYHGPGQLVVYPIVRLPAPDVRAWLATLERFGCAVCASFGLQGQPSLDGTGVFVDGRKVASIGVAIRRWINLHGIAINVAMDLAPFHRVRPCGLDPTVMTDLSRAARRPISLDDARRAARDHVHLLVAGPRR